MATHSSILDWRIPWTEEPGGLESHKELDTTERLSTHTQGKRTKILRWAPVYTGITYTEVDMEMRRLESDVIIFAFFFPETYRKD